MRLPVHQPARALVTVAGYVVGVAVAGVGLVLTRGVLLGGLLAVLLAAALTVPLAVLARRPVR